jgi:hypothetical protein
MTHNSRTCRPRTRVIVSREKEVKVVAGGQQDPK